MLLRNYRETCCMLLMLACMQSPVPGQVSLRYEENYTLTYEEAIRAYQELDEAYPEARLLSYGSSDVGKPLHLFVISSGRTFAPEAVKEEGKRILLILNGIHPGESCGIDASVEFSRHILEKKDDLYSCLSNTVLCIVPVFNIGGTLNRSPYHRTNQDPPIEAGFRGNARNLDLNRDFIKLDTRNTRSFVRIFRDWDPDVFLDNHVTNGSDHQYTLTLVNNILEKLDPGLGDFLEQVMLPELYSAMSETPYEICPYVRPYRHSPEQGMIQADDPPRFSAGYTALFNTISFLNETHVYKPFPNQVKATYEFMKVLLAFTSRHGEEIASLRAKALQATCEQEDFVLRWELDTTRWEELYFKGYAYKSRTSELTGQRRDYYDREDPWERNIPYYRYYRPVLSVRRPDYFIIPQAWDEVIERLRLNRIALSRLDRDTVMRVEAFYIENISFADRPSNGHFEHDQIEVRSEYQDIRFYKGDVIVPLNQPGNRYLMETLDPRGDDSFMRWNFFSPILNRREYFSPAGFERKAVEILENDPALREEFEKRKAGDPGFAASDWMQLNFIYTHSPWSEKSFMRYPVYRVNGD